MLTLTVGVTTDFAEGSDLLRLLEDFGFDPDFDLSRSAPLAKHQASTVGSFANGVEARHTTPTTRQRRESVVSYLRER